MEQNRKCTNEHCDVGLVKGLDCNDGNDPISDCPFWQKTMEQLESIEPSVETNPIDNKYSLSWTGNALGSHSLKVLTERGTPFIVGVIGENDSGKTTFLRLLYLLLRNGKSLKTWRFAGSYTFRAWENVTRFLEFNDNNKIAFPPHTSMSDGRNDGLLHLSMKDKSRFKDFVFTDTTGEWFREWAKNANSKNADGAKWIHNNADVFIFFIDCEALIEQKWKAERSISNLMLRLKDNLDNRKVAVLWSKSDKYKDIQASIIKKLEKSLKANFDNYKEFKISAYDNETHEIALDIMNWLVQPEKMALTFIPRAEYEEDYFLNYHKQFQND
jgi:energy-coupling factor transporter ATP-binding protein EcfA2